MILTINIAPFKPHLIIKLRHFRPFFIIIFSVLDTILEVIFTPILPPNAHKCARLISECSYTPLPKIGVFKWGTAIIKRGVAILTVIICIITFFIICGVLCQS